MNELRIGISGWRYEGLARKRSMISPRDIFVYFDNDAKVHAPFDAKRLATRLGVS
jgi:uncharacterized protein YecE (DUF72 family)